MRYHLLQFSVAFIVLVFMRITPGFGQSAERKVFTAKSPTFISIKDLRRIYHWDGIKRIWKCGDEPSGMIIHSNRYALSHEANSSENGIAFDFVEGGNLFGCVGLGNIQIEGTVFRKKAGLQFSKGAKLIYSK